MRDAESNNHGLAARVRAATGFNPRQAGIFGAMLVVLAALGARAMFGAGGAGGPSRAVGGTVKAAAPGSTSAATLSAAAAPSVRAAQPSKSRGRLQQWLAEPVRPVTRNLFAVRLEYYPPDGSRPGQGIRTARDGEFWGLLEKSLSLQADQRDKRQNLLANFRTEAGKLRLDSTIMGPQPKALIDGKLVAEGDVVAGFRVLKIEPRRITIEREGIRLEIQMK